MSSSVFRPLRGFRSLAILLFLGCAGMAAEPQRGGTLRWVVNFEPTSLVALTTTAGTDYLLSSKVTEGLVTYDADANPQPQLATSWSVAPDGKTITFALRKGVRWHDGKDFTSADVAFSILLLKKVHPRGSGTFANVTDVTTPDRDTVVIHLSQPAPYILSALSAAESPIVPKHIYENTNAQTNPANAAPIGTGPFKFKEWIKGSHVIYDRNDDYWDKPKPYLDRIVVRLIPDGPGRSAAFETGEIDIGGVFPIPFSDVERLRARPNLVVEEKGYEFLPTTIRLEFNLENEFFKDVRVRQAFAHAIDREVALKLAWQGFGETMTGPIPPAMKRYYTADVPRYPFDLKTAERLLDEAGYKRGADGKHISLTFDPTTSDPNYRLLADYIRQALAKVGVDVTIRSQDFATYLKRIYTDRDWAFTIHGRNATSDPTLGVQRLFWSQNRKKGVPFTNGAFYANPEVDRLFETAAVEIDPAKRADLFKQVQRIIVTDLPAIDLFVVKQFTLADRKVKNHTRGVDGIHGNLADAYIEAAK
ncbi:ABC transporter substrate-binding protein [Bosea sp. RCC_152_1]|uniref:ABC transporter substrate-binding protein n=1 Tax=Bosea sp. RCC_152_1 TaxID=3239228 RepID=UPI003523F80B